MLPTVTAQVASTTEEMVRHLGGLALDDAAATIGMMEAALAAEVMVEMDNEKSAAIMGLVDSEKGALIMAKMPAELAVWMMGAMEVGKVSDVWSRVEKVKAGEIMEMVPIEIAVKVVEMVSEERLVPRLPEAYRSCTWTPGIGLRYLPTWSLQRLPGPMKTSPSTRWRRPGRASGP